MIFYNITTIYALVVFLLILSVLFAFIGRRGIALSYIFNIIIIFTIASYSFLLEEVAISDLVFLDKFKLQYIFVFSIICLCMLIVNGYETLNNIGNSLINTITLIVSISILGATDLITFFLSLLVPILLSSVLVAVNSDSKKIALVATYINMIMIGMFLFAIGLYYAETGSILIDGKFAHISDVGLLAIVLFFTTTAFFTGTFPAYTVIFKITNSEYNKNYASDVLFIWSLIGYAVLHNLFKIFNIFLQPDDRIFVVFNIFLAIVILVPSLISIYKKEIKEVIACIFMSHAGYAMLTVNLFFDQKTSGLLLEYFIYHGIIFASLLIILNSIKHNNKNIIYGREVYGFIYNQKFLGTIVFVMLLSLMGAPFSAGAYSKFSLFLELAKHKHFFLIGVSLTSMILGATSLFKTFFPFFLKNNRQSQYNVDLPKRYLLILGIFCFFILARGVIPKGIDLILK